MSYLVNFEPKQVTQYEKMYHNSVLFGTGNLSSGLSGKIYGDKGYISKDLFGKLYNQGLRLFTGIRKGMKNYLLDVGDKMLLRKRSLIESVFNVLKNSMKLEHTRHRSPTNFLVHTLACITAYSITKITSVIPINFAPLS